MKEQHKTSPVFFCLSPVLVFFLISYLVSLSFIAYAVLTENIILNSQDAFDSLMGFYQSRIFEIEALAYILTFCYAYFLKFRKFEVKCFDHRYYNFIEFKDVIWAIICAVGVYLITDIVLVILDGIFDLQSVLNAHNESVTSILSDNIIKNVILVGLLAPITEEILFRGLVFNRIRLLSNMKIAIFTSSAIFAFMHVGTFIQVGYAFALGLVLSISYAKFKNIKIPIIIHMAFNLTNCIYYIPGIESILDTFIGHLVYYVLGVACAVYSVKKFRKRRTPVGKDDLLLPDEEDKNWYKK